MTADTQTSVPFSVGQAAPDVAMVPTIAVVTPCRATYFKPLWEAFAEAQPKPWRTVLFWPEGHDSEHPEHLLTPEANNLTVRRVASRKIATGVPHRGAMNWRAPQRFHASRELRRALAAAEPKLVVVQEYSPFALTGLLYARWRGIPVVTFTEIGAGNCHFFNHRVRLWHGFWSLFVQGIAAACPTAHRPVCRRRLPSISLYHAVDSRLYRPKPLSEENSVVTFVYVGQFIPRKGLDLWIKAARALKEQTSVPFRMRFIGSGHETWLRELVREAGLEEQAEWPGFLSGAALRDAMQRGDVFVLPSRQDTYAVVSHEAACLGLPLLISKHAGSAEAIVREGVNGHIIDPDDTAGFTAAMRGMLNRATRERMARAARECGEEMSAHRRGEALWDWMKQTFALNHP